MRGKIINISSVAGKKGTPFSGLYAASKHALEGYSECLRQELMMFGIDVIIIGPGVIKTPIWDKNHQQNIERFAATDYGPALKELIQISTQYVNKGYPASKVGRRIVRILASKRPAVRYSIMANRWTNAILFGFIPKRWMDIAIAWRLKLRRKKH
jgi:short-subunit dehydrogenase